MVARLLSVSIQNFRSIQNIDLSLEDLTVLVGDNDCGKSNIIRALNLFFNGQTDIGREFSFADDYNIHAQEKKRKAKEISISVRVAIPEAYQKKNGDEIVWEKKWRSEGLYHSSYYGVRYVRGPRGGRTKRVFSVPVRSNVHLLLRRIRFEYVPAIKGNEYFDYLRSRIYSVISEVASEGISNSSEAFQQKIAEYLINLTEDIEGILKYKTKLSLPRDLTPIFSKLDFRSGPDLRISLSQRGDGIKARHIPMMLKFVSEKTSALQTRGTAPYTFIWGYEEPENNVEIRRCFDLARDFENIVSGKISQIILITHSPVFYNLTETGFWKRASANRHHLFMDTPEKGTEIAKGQINFDEKMGLVELAAPAIKVLQQQVQASASRIAEAEKKVEQYKRYELPTIFVEGFTDKKVLARALRLFFPGSHESIHIEAAPKGGGGANFVTDRLIAWSLAQKHAGSEALKAFGLYDNDAAGKKAKKELHEAGADPRYVQAVLHSVPQPLREFRAAGFLVPITLEETCDLPVWEHANANGWLETRDLYPIASEALRKKAVEPGKDLPSLLPDNEFKLLVQYAVAEDKKKVLADYLCKCEEDQFKSLIVSLRGQLKEVVDFLL